MEKIYRPNVGIALFNHQGLFWSGQYNSNDFIAWQMPQGGIEQDASIEQTAFKELYEETGITADKVKIIKISTEKHRYDFQEEIRRSIYAGQEQIWILMQFLGQDTDINLSTQTKDEFKNWKWASSDEILQDIAPYKKDIYKKVFEEFLPLLNSNLYAT